jgi:hypothetical protein
VTPADRAILADGILLLHAAIIAFNIFGLIVTPLGAWRRWAFVRIFWWRALHLGSWAIVALQAVFGRACFLTMWQGALQSQAGAPATTQPMIMAWINTLIFWPLPLWAFSLIYIAVALYAVGLWWLVPPHCSGGISASR